INNLVEFLEYEAEEKNIRFFVSGDATIQADRTLLQRVLMNLLSNAIRYSPAQATVEIEASGNPDQTVIEIRNPGTVALNADKLFHRFWRGDNARQSAGYGLGLSLVKAIMTLHSATVSYRFRDGKHI